MASPPPPRPARLPWSELLKVNGINTSEGCNAFIKKISDLFRGNFHLFNGAFSSESQVKANGEKLTQYLESLQFLLMQLLSEGNDGHRNCTLKVCQEISCDVIDPYLELLSTGYYTSNESISSINLAVQSISSMLLQYNSAMGQKILDIFLYKLEKLYKNSLVMHENHSMSNVYSIISILSHAINQAGPVKLESNELSLAELFEKTLSVLKEGDLRTCHLVCSTLLPLLVVGDPKGRAVRIWKFVKDVYSRTICVVTLGIDLILTIFCCLSDIFLYRNESSPFSAFFCRSQVVGREEPVLDLRKDDQFWEMVQYGLMSHDALARKQALYLVRSVLASVRELKSNDCVVSDQQVFWWSKDCEALLSKAWDDLVLILETMEEKQVSI